MGAGPSGVAGEEGKDLEFLGSELDVAAFQVDLVVDEVDVERPDRKVRRRLLFGGFCAAVADGGANASFELGHAEGLGDVVVGSSVEGGDLPVLGAGGGEDDDGYVAPLADPLAYGESVDVGQAEVEHDDVRGCQGGLGDPLLAVDGGDDLVAARRQPETQGPQEGRVVVHDEDLGHGRLARCPVGRGEWQREDEAGAAVGDVFDPDVFAVGF